jgi:acetyltransferase-like isoleucine patch superfamily enzyme
VVGVCGLRTGWRALKDVSIGHDGEMGDQYWGGTDARSRAGDEVMIVESRCMGLRERVKSLLKNAVVRTASIGLRVRLSWVYHIWGLRGVDRILTLCDSRHVGFILTRFGAVVGGRGDLNAPLLIHNADRDYSNLIVGNDCHVGKDVFLDLRDTITIEDSVTISMRSTILTHTDAGQSPLRVRVLPSSHSAVLIRQGAYVGAGTIILQGVTVGQFAVVGAGAVVTRDVPAYGVAVGAPARVVRFVERGAVAQREIPVGIELPIRGLTRG